LELFRDRVKHDADGEAFKQRTLAEANQGNTMLNTEAEVRPAPLAIRSHSPPISLRRNPVRSWIQREWSDDISRQTADSAGECNNFALRTARPGDMGPRF
jgi:hypothetical protein